ncbi:acid protease, partial [Tothia fuscella]
ILAAARDVVYLVPIQFGNQSFLSVLDTGSSDTWLVGPDYDCIDLFDGATIPDFECRLGPQYNTTSTFNQIPEQHFKIAYADGEFLNGIMGREDVTLAGITVPQQTVGIVNYAAWMGDEQSSGLVGLAYPSITRAYAGNNTQQHIKSMNIAYSPIFTSMTRLNLTAPLFSLALGRDGKPGVLAFGGLPGGAVRHSPKFARASIEFLTMSGADGVIRAQTEYQMYTITADSFIFSAKKARYLSKTPKVLLQSTSTPTQIIIDSGTTMLFLPFNTTKAINALWSPPAHYNEDSRTYFVHCNATAPRFGVTIGGQTFWINPNDLIQDADIGGKICMSGIQPGSDGISVLGDIFLKNVLAVFDVGAGEMRFAARR